MKAQRSGTSSRITKLLGLLIMVALIKLLILGLAVDIPFPFSWDSFHPTAKTQDADSKSKNETRLPLQVAELAGSKKAWAQDNATMPDDSGVMDSTTDGEPPSLKREALLKKQDELNRREQALKLLEKEIDEKLARLKKLESDLQGMLEQAGEVKDKKLRHLVDVYSNMKAKQAAVVIETLDQKIAVKILAGMRGRQAGEILTYVDPDIAANLSESLTKMQLPFE